MNDYELFQAGMITHDELLQRQRNEMPRCIYHSGRPAHGRIPDGDVCEECGSLWILATTMRRKAGSLIVGGYEL